MWGESTRGGYPLHKDLLRDRAAERAVLAVHAEHERPVEGVLLADLDPPAGTQTERVEEGDNLWIRGARYRDDGDVAGLEVVEGRHVGEVVGLEFRDREAVRARCRPVQRDEDAGLDFVREVVLERGCQPVGLDPGVAEHVGEEPLDDAMAPDRADCGLAARGRELDALVQAVLDQASIRQTLHRRRHRRRADLELLGEIAGVGGFVALGQPVHGLEGLPLRFRQLREVHVGWECGFRTLEISNWTSSYPCWSGPALSMVNRRITR